LIAYYITLRADDMKMKGNDTALRSGDTFLTTDDITLERGENAERMV
jgi:hypothetical protein